MLSYILYIIQNSSLVLHVITIINEGWYDLALNLSNYSTKIVHNRLVPQWLEDRSTEMIMCCACRARDIIYFHGSFCAWGILIRQYIIKGQACTHLNLLTCLMEFTIPSSYPACVASSSHYFHSPLHTHTHAHHWYWHVISLSVTFPYLWFVSVCVCVYKLLQFRFFCLCVPVLQKCILVLLLNLYLHDGDSRSDFYCWVCQRVWSMHAIIFQCYLLQVIDSHL